MSIDTHRTFRSTLLRFGAIPLLLSVAVASGCSGDDDKVGPKNAVLKVCNFLSLANNQQLNLVFEYGPEPQKVNLTGVQCSPAVGMPCLAVPSGKSMAAVVRRSDVPDSPILASMVLDVKAGEELIFLTSILVDPEDAAKTPIPVLDGGPLRAEFKCQTLDPLAPSTTPPPGGGGPTLPPGA